ncbi:MAG TPA: hypothetical protein VMS37_13795 [Verrucomicrobiae bacterium]|nr:hypothetical protein [Verrucomicrobiae bacterium]
MCSACSGHPEDPPEGQPELEAVDASPFWAIWNGGSGEVEEGDEGEGREGEVTR